MASATQYTDVAQELYVTYFGRPADHEGLLNMTAALAAANAATDANGLNQQYKTNAAVRTLIDSFGSSAESAALYTGSLTEFVTSIYQNLFNRQPDLPGLDFWVHAITSGSETRASAAQAIMAGALQNTTDLGKQDAAIINHKVAVANNFSTAIDTAAEVNAYSGMAAAATARAMLHQVDASTNPAVFQANVVETLKVMVSGPVVPVVAAPVATSAIITLTPGIDNTTSLVTPAADTIVTTASNLQMADVVAGGIEDTLKITLDNGDYTLSDQQDGTKKIEVHAHGIGTLKVTDRTTLLQNRDDNGFARDTNFDGRIGGHSTNAAPGAKSGDARDSDTVDSVFVMTLAKDIKRIESLSSEVNGSAVTFNDIQKINVGNVANPQPFEIRIEDTGSAHNFLFDVEAAGPKITAADVVDHNDPVKLELSEARGLTINFGETPAGQAANNTLPVTTPFANAKNPDVLGENQNDGQGPLSNGLDYGLAAAAQSKIDTLTIDSQVRGPAGVRQVFRNEVLDLNVGKELNTLIITGDAQLKVGLEFTVEQGLLLNQSTTTIPVANANPDTSGPVVAGPAPYSYGVTPAAGSQIVMPNVLRDFALTKPAYSLDDNIRNVDASAHYTDALGNPINQAARALVANLPVADLTLDFSNGTTDNSVANDKFTYSGSQGDDLINFGVRTINKDIRLNFGNDTVVAGRGQDTIRGGVGDDVIKHNNANNVLDRAGEGFAAGASVTVYGGAGNDKVMTAGQTSEGQTNLIDLGIGNDTLYVDNATHDDDVNGSANHRIAGGLGADTIVITTAGKIEHVVPEVLDNIIYADVALGVGVGADDEHQVSDIKAWAPRDVRDPAQLAGRVANAGFIADSYFASVQAGGPGDSDTVVITDSSNDYVNLGNGNNSYVHGALTTGDNNSFINLEPGELTADAGRNSDTVDSGNGNDVVGIYTDGIKQVDTRGGDDVITLKGHGNVTVLAGDGNDDVVINSISTTPTGNQPANYIDLGAGDDTLLISSKGVSYGVTEIYGREGRDVVSILNTNPIVNTNHTLYVDLGVGADVLELRARDLSGDDTVFGGNDGSIDQLILRNLNSDSVEYVMASDTARVNGFELIDLRDAGKDLLSVSEDMPGVAVAGLGGIQLTVTQHLVQQVDQTVTVGAVTAYVYGVDVHALPSDGANQDVAVDGQIDDDGLFNAGILGLDTSYLAKGILTITTVEHGVNDADFIIGSNNNYALTQTVDLRAMGVDSYVNFLGGTARDVVIVDEASMNSFSNLRFDEFSIDTRLATKPWIIDEDNSTLDTLRVVVNNDTNDVADISFGDYRNVQGLDAIVLSSNDDIHAANFRIEASAFLVNQTTSVLVPGAHNAADWVINGSQVQGLLVSVEDFDVATIYSSATGQSIALTGGSIAGGVNGIIANDFVTVDGMVDIIAVGINQFLIADHATVV